MAVAPKPLMSRSGIPLTARPQLGEIAISGFNDITKPWIGALEHPLDYVAQRALNDPAVYDELLRDSQVSACFGQRQRAVTSRDWQVVPGDESRAAKKAAKALEELLVRIRFDNLTEKMLFARFHGFAVAEIVWTTDCGRWDWSAIKVRNRRRFRFGADGSLRLLTRTNMTEGEIVPPANFWTLSAGADNDDEPYGRGLASWLYWPVFFKRNGLKYWLTFLEKFGSPTAIGHHPAGAPKEDVDKLLAAAEAVTFASAIAVPDTMKLELLEAGRSGAGDYEAHHHAQDAAISKIILGQTMTTDDGSSRAQGQVHFDVRQDIVEADADWLNESFNTGPVALWSAFNYGADVPPPRVERSFSEPDDLDALASRDLQLKQLGWERDDDSFVEVYGDGYQRSTPDQTDPSAVDGAPGDPASPPPALAAGDPPPETAPGRRDDIDRIVDVLTGDDGWRATMDPVVRPLIDFIDQAAADGLTLEQTRALIDAQGPALLAAMNPGPLADRLADAGFAVGIAGRLGLIARQRPD